ncbi:MAG: NUDIX domain-containing protein [Candidatus Campbellbacteria bacterium]|nr:NUDIX domain-containing protein [Candidatus Campbellbacteria bacterium]
MDIQRDYAYGVIPFYRELSGEYVFFIGKTQGKDGRKIFWKFPKGHKDSDEEDEAEAAARELREETGMSLEPNAVINSSPFSEEYFYEKPDGSIIRKINTYFLGQVTTPGSEVPNVTIEENEFSEYKWAGFEEVLRLLPENSREMFREAHDFLVRNKV